MPIYGIDLGTSNSLIGLEETGYLSELVPSCVNMQNGDCGGHLYNDMSAKRSFKVDISMGKEGMPSIVASACVLKKLKEMAGGECVKDVVITVPAYFSDNQREATVNAAARAGLNVMSLLNEPTAAAVYIAEQHKGLFVVFDLGGGTFDVSIIDSRFGTYDVQATGGLKLGGDDFDRNLVSYFMKMGNIKLFRLEEDDRLSLQHYCTAQKTKMQRLKAAFDVDLTRWEGGHVTFTPEAYKEVMQVTFNPTISCLKKLTSSYIQDNERYDILPVGGSTRCPFLRAWIGEATGQKVSELTYNPDMVVAQGAAKYAHMLENKQIDTLVSDVTRQLSIGLEDGTCRVLVPDNSKVPLSVENIFVNPVKARELILELYQGSRTFSKDNELIGELKWDYGMEKEEWTGQVFVHIDIDNAGIITFSARELLREPKEIKLDRKSC